VSDRPRGGGDRNVQMRWGAHEQKRREEETSRASQKEIPESGAGGESVPHRTKREKKKILQTVPHVQGSGESTEKVPEFE